MGITQEQADKITDLVSAQHAYIISTRPWYVAEGELLDYVKSLVSPEKEPIIQNITINVMPDDPQYVAKKIREELDKLSGITLRGGWSVRR